MNNIIKTKRNALSITISIATWIILCILVGIFSINTTLFAIVIFVPLFIVLLYLIYNVLLVIFEDD
jgi:hypothetical protein